MSSAGPPPAKAFSCIRCFERKVKCDKQSPCTNCVKSKVECIFRIPPAPRRRKKRTQEDLLLARLKKCEELLKSKGVDIDSEIGSTGPAASTTLGSPSSSHPITSPHQLSPDAETVLARQREIFLTYPPELRKSGQLIVDQGKSRFIENPLWASLSDEFRQPNEVIAEYSDDEDEVGSLIEESTDFILGYTPSSNPVQHLHPSPANILILWQMFLDNINPMTKLIHQPTLHKTLVQASSQLDNLPRGLEALMFAIYSSALYSIDDDECEMKLGEPRKILLARYRHATRKALARARFMATSELVVLQAFFLYLLTMREDYDARTTWTLAGVASRIGQGMGLHRDGTNLGVSPFETEMRRRLWWQITTLDFRSAELSGSGRSGEFSLSDTLVPSNVNDEDIYPEMKEPPISHTRPTEMISCLLRCELGNYWKEKFRQRSNVALEVLRIDSPSSTYLEERDSFINELEQRLEEKFLRYCDPSNPIQFMAIIIGRGAINSMRLMAHHPRKWPNGKEIPAAEKEYLWNVSMSLFEGVNLAHSSKQLRRFMWHTRVFFVWQAFIYILSELKERTLGDDVDKAWQEIDEIYRHHPQFVTDYKKPLHVAVGSLCLKAYSAREKALRETTNGVFPKVIPEYIKQLREQRESGPLKRATTTAASSSTKAATNADSATAVGTERSDQYSTTETVWENAPLSDQPTSNYTAPQFSASGFSTGGAGIPHQLPLPAFQPIPTPLAGDGVMLAPPPNFSQDLDVGDMPMDWAQWDMIMQDFDGQMTYRG
ncbi:uncharacterized protein Z520_07766 [Fonsecaea multimorphosa CBS 102226]|uniref:Zn(2)-C6 fungal-type domain-containing protein n=1 Tax=Fonsecaea multimorphosa CBS 102226 TaxID=1442371 RepID=A0A0D2H3T6_9EURO|nr:uncharacterized protein Z520_07766 [Fonsecaea multimorphosa CBS 102226]KIX96500.1 hypothetical protein Z520_07766 [Fonsecaea multimorphosa CBS 102226]OAL28300.1 hypothetical protein AYO22_03006 [Fonsecaea multimorphosa]